jgi:D-3-phosphoglycerate dehydrogenase
MTIKKRADWVLAVGLQFAYNQRKRKYWGRISLAKKVVIPQDITDAGKDFLKAHGYEVVVGSGKTDADSVRAVIADADGILARTAPYPKDVLAAAKHLKVIGRHGIGVDNIDVEYCTQNGIWVVYAPNSNAVSVAEHTIAA